MNKKNMIASFNVFKKIEREIVVTNSNFDFFSVFETLFKE